MARLPFEDGRRHVHRIEKFTLTRFVVDLDRPIGDSQISVTQMWIGALELEDDSGNVGTGFFHSVTDPLPSLVELEKRFEHEVAPDVVGASPFAWVNRLSRPRGGNIRTSIFHPSIEQAMWDLQGQILELPLHRLLGSRRDRVPAYASGLEFHADDEQVSDFYQTARAAGFSAFKVKVGHPDIEWDIRRLKLVRAVVGDDCLMMADANEAWSPKVAIRRLHAFREAGIDLYWMEDPCLRFDFEGLAAVRNAAPFTLINSGEYLDVSGKRQLIERRAADIVNLHGSIDDAMRIGWLAAEHGIPVAVGNTSFEIGAHIAAALPEAQWLEYSFFPYNHLIDEPIQFKDGYALLPERPGHGLKLAEAARGEFGRPA
jgi:L-alanine-DL-glutamate epimerase-like enolase superfamily enzyme